ncbi:MAG: DUF721 domain-containing protein [Nitrospinota bacterium]
MSGFLSVGQVLKGLTQSAPWGRGVRRYEVIRHWVEVVGPAVAHRAQPVEIRGRTLYVEVADPVWLQQLVFLTDSIRRALNEAVGREAIDRIFLRLGDGPGEREFPEQDVKDEASGTQGARLFTQAPDRRAVQAALSKIADRGVREALANLLSRAEDRKK